jgi:hypothetical protein
MDVDHEYEYFYGRNSSRKGVIKSVRVLVEEHPSKCALALLSVFKMTEVAYDDSAVGPADDEDLVRVCRSLCNWLAEVHRAFAASFAGRARCCPTQT